MAVPQNLPQLTVTRFVAAFFVVAFHFGQQAWPLTTFPLNQWVMEGGLGVGFFFVLSGFVLMWVYGAENARLGKSYWMARIARIFPLYLVTFLVSLLIVLFVRHEYPRGLSIILQAVGLHAWVPGYSLSVNFPGWTVAVELFFYACFPFLLPLFRRGQMAVLATVVLVLYAASQALHVHWAEWMPALPAAENSDFLLRFPLWHLPSFLIGMWAARLTRAHYQAWRGVTGVMLALVASAALLGILSTVNPLRTYAAGGLLAPLFAMLVVGLALLPDAPAKLVGHRALVFLGEISFGLYLWQCPVYMVWEGLLGLGGVTGDLFWGYLLSLLAVSVLSYVALEKPARTWLRRI